MDKTFLKPQFGEKVDFYQLDLNSSLVTSIQEKIATISYTESYCRWFSKSFYPT